MSEWDKLKEIKLIPYRAGVLLQEDNYEKKDVDRLLSRVWIVGDEMQNDARKYRLLQEDDPDASIVISDELNEACLELDECRQKLEAIDGKHLRWIYERLIYKYGEKQNVDYMLKFNEILEVLGDE